MKKHLISLSLIFFCIKSFSQSKFENGYFINNSNEKIKCLIENEKWEVNPSSFNYKESEDSPILTLTNEDIKELKVGNYKFVQFPDNTDSRLVRYLIEGKANLYSYKGTNFEVFYFNTNSDTHIKELKPVKTLLVNGKQVEQHNNYKQQLWDNVKCGKELKELQKLEFSKSNLVNHFINYNRCSNSEFYNYLKNEGKGQFNLKLKGGVNISSLSIPILNNDSENFVDFGTVIGYRFGTELEFVLPISNNNWAVHFEPTYTIMKSENNTLTFPEEVATLEYNTIEIPMGIKRYINLSANSRLFLNASYIIAFNQNSSIEFENSNPIEFSKFTNWAFGIGFDIHKKYGMEFRYYTSKNNMFKETYYQSEYENISIAFVYTIFSNN